MTHLTHKGYQGSVEASLEDECLHGRVQFINDIISYEGETVAELKRAFEQAVDRYLAYCEEHSTAPDKPFSGTFNVRTGAELHRKLAMAASVAEVSLNEFVVGALARAVETGHVVRQDLGLATVGNAYRFVLDSELHMREQYASLPAAQVIFDARDYSSGHMLHPGLGHQDRVSQKKVFAYATGEVA